MSEEPQKELLGSMSKKGSSYNTDRGVIDRRVAELSERFEDASYHIGFRHFDNKKYDLKNAKASELRKVFEFLQNVGQCQNYEDLRRVPQEIKPVINNNHYAKYFKDLTEDVELKEFDAGSLRGFFFFEHFEKKLQLVAIDKHPEYKKQKR